VVFQGRLHPDQSRGFKASHLSYARYARTQHQVAVKVPGSFRPGAGTRYLHRGFSFAGSSLETLPKSLRHSCGSELHIISVFPQSVDYTFISPSIRRSLSFLYFRLPDGFIEYAISIISARCLRFKWRFERTIRQILANFSKSAEPYTSTPKKITKRFYQMQVSLVQRDRE